MFVVTVLSQKLILQADRPHGADLGIVSHTLVRHPQYWNPWILASQYSNINGHICLQFLGAKAPLEIARVTK